MAVSKQTWEFAFWATALLGAAVAVILYQHSVHTGILLAAGQASPAGPEEATTATGAASPATGVATPLGAWGSVFAYNPPVPGGFITLYRPQGRTFADAPGLTGEIVAASF